MAEAEQNQQGRCGRIERMLATLAKHGHIVAMAIEGPVSPGEVGSKKAFDELVEISALKPADEGIYRLNPRLRDFIADHLVSYGAYQNLTRISDVVDRCKAQWEGVLSHRESGAIAQAEQLEWAIEDTVAELSYAIERNITLLNAMVATQYGNVSSLSAKRSQNRFYAREVCISLDEMDLIDHLVDDMGADALARGMLEFKRKLHLHLGSRLLSWRSQLKDAQTSISKRLFRSKQMEQRLNNLSQMAMWLNQHKTKDGFEMVELGGNPPFSLFRPDPVKVRAQLDVRDMDPMVLDTMVRAVEKLPEKKDPFGQPTARQPQTLKVGAVSVVPEELMPEDAEIEHLVMRLRQTGGSCSLLDWKHAREPVLSGITDEEWLLYASSQLVAQGIHVEMLAVKDASLRTENKLFFDFLAS